MDKNTLLSYQPNYYKNSKVMGNIDTANANELTLLNGRLVDLNNQFYVGTVTTALERWEKQFGIKVNTGLTLAARRNRILAKIRGQGTSTKEMIKSVAKSFIGDKEVDIIEHNEEYWFEVVLKSFIGFDNSEGLYESIEEIKPAHLNVNYKLISKSQSKFYVAAANLVGERIKTYPWTPTKIESKAQTFIPMNDYLQLEKITVYPKEES